MSDYSPQQRGLCCCCTLLSKGGKGEQANMIKLGFLARELVGILTSVGLVLGVAAITLWVLNGVPTQIQGTNKVLEFKDTRDAQLALGIKISRPAYFPDYLAWPPALIQAQKRPAIAVLMT